MVNFVKENKSWILACLVLLVIGFIIGFYSSGDIAAGIGTTIGLISMGAGFYYSQSSKIKQEKDKQELKQTMAKIINQDNQKLKEKINQQTAALLLSQKNK